MYYFQKNTDSKTADVSFEIMETINSGSTILSTLYSNGRQQLSTQNSASSKTSLQETGKINPLSEKEKKPFAADLHY